jgi:ligand-binding SRPBCC domain-containing protein
VSDVYELATWQWLPRARPEMFAFFADAHHLERITPAFLRFQVTTSGPIVMRAGAFIDYRLRLHGIPLRWRSEITMWEPPRLFADVQRRGPYRQWEHTHSFDEQDGGTMVRDRVLYRLHGPDLLARGVHALVVEPDIQRIFRFRHAALEDAFGAAGHARSGPVRVVRCRL